MILIFFFYIIAYFLVFLKFKTIFKITYGLSIILIIVLNLLYRYYRRRSVSFTNNIASVLSGTSRLKYKKRSYCKINTSHYFKTLIHHDRPLSIDNDKYFMWHKVRRLWAKWLSKQTNMFSRSYWVQKRRNFKLSEMIVYTNELDDWYDDFQAYDTYRLKLDYLTGKIKSCLRFNEAMDTNWERIELLKIERRKLWKEHLLYADTLGIWAGPLMPWETMKDYRKRAAFNKKHGLRRNEEKNSWTNIGLNHQESRERWVLEEKKDAEKKFKDMFKIWRTWGGDRIMDETLEVYLKKAKKNKEDGTWFDYKKKKWRYYAETFLEGKRSTYLKDLDKQEKEGW